MSISPKDAKILELNRFLDDLERAALAGPLAFDRAFNAPPVGMSVHEISPQKKFTRVSSGHRALIGYSPAELLGKSPADYVFMKQVSESAMTRKFGPGAILLPLTRGFRRADGTEITLLQVERHLKDENGGIIGIRTVLCEAPKPL